MAASTVVTDREPGLEPTTVGLRDRRRYDFLVLCFWGAVLAWCSLPLSPNATDSDFWGHVQYGRDLLRHGLPANSTYTYTAVGQPWINHEILSEVAFALCVDHWGSGSLVMLKSLSALIMIVSMIWQARRQGSSILSTALIILVVAWSVSFYWSTRPQVFSFLCFGLMIWCLTWALPKWTLANADRSSQGLLAHNNGMCKELSRPSAHFCWLVALVPLMALWTNFHGGVLAGIAVLFAYLGLRSLEYTLGSCGTEWPFCFKCLCLGVGCVSATLLNPYGLQLHTWLVDSVFQPRPEVVEWRPLPWWDLDSLPAWTLLGVSLLSFAGATLNRKRCCIDWVQWTLLLVTAWQVTEHRRHLPFFAILCGYWLPPSLNHFLSFVHQKTFPSNTMAPMAEPLCHKSPTHDRIHRHPFGGLRLIACCLLLLVTLHWSHQWWQRIQSMQVARNAFPVAAFQFMADHQLQGKLFSTGRWGQYVLAIFGAREPSDPGIRVGFDGRYDTCYPRSVVDIHFDFTVGTDAPTGRYRGIDSPLPDPARALELHQPDYLLLDRREPHAMRIIQSKVSDWTLLYQDSLAQIWGRSEIVNQPTSGRHISPTDRRISDDVQQGWVRWPASPNHTTFISQKVLADNP
ncbi:MAG: hypothetical protein O2931_11420 [Planctomycetota bacterium]|nr:hypothetical protein [Planctomycetota bacterium]